jgi:uroporphyrinogen decarboxylase
MVSICLHCEAWASRIKRMMSREIVQKALKGETLPRPACGPLAVHFCAVDAGVSLHEFAKDPQVHVDCLLRYLDKYRPDVLWVSADTWVTAEAMGTVVYSPDETQPLVGPSQGFLLADQDLDNIPPPDPYSQGRQPLMLEVLSRIVEILGSEVFVVGCFDQSPFSLACQIGGMESILSKTITDPAFVDAVLDRCGEYVFAYAEAMAACGPDMLSTGDSPAALMGLPKYSAFALPAEKKVFSALKEKTDAFLSLHICGDSTSLFDQMAKSGADVLEIDHQVSLRKAYETVGDRVALWVISIPFRFYTREIRMG